MNEPYFCPTLGEILLPKDPGHDKCCTHQWVHVPMPDIRATHKIAAYLTDRRAVQAEAQEAESTFRTKLAKYAIELLEGPDRVRSRTVHDRLVVMLKMPWESDEMKTDRALNDPEGLWGPVPGWRCWSSRHAECEPLGADESCTCACGLGMAGHGLDQNGVRTIGCDCGHEGMGITWHSRECVWRSSRG